MYSKFISLALAGALGTAFLSGCQCHHDYVAARPYCSSCVDTIQPPPAQLVPVPARPYVPPPPPSGPAPAGYYAPAPQSRPPLPRGSRVPPPPPDGEAAPRESSSFSAETPPSVKLLPPEPIRRDAARKPADQTKEPPVASVPEKPAPKPEDEAETPNPIDIPGYALARPNVASARQPFADGIDWLKKRGFRVVLHLRPPGEDDAAAQRIFEKKGLKYISLEASPARLTPEVYEEFNRLIADTNNHPLFVYDKDGSVAGGLWYLHNRVALKQTDEKARAEAERLGLRIADDDIEHKTMWLAVQALLKKLMP